MKSSLKSITICLILILGITSCALKVPFNTRAKFTAQEPSTRTIQWVLLPDNRVPEYVLKDIKVCKFNSKVTNMLNETVGSTPEIKINSTWSKIVSVFSTVGGWFVGIIGWIGGLF